MFVCVCVSKLVALTSICFMRFIQASCTMTIDDNPKIPPNNDKPYISLGGLPTGPDTPNFCMRAISRRSISIWILGYPN